MRKKMSILAISVCAGCIIAANGMAAEEERLISLTDPMAAFLETRAYAEKMGATA